MNKKNMVTGFVFVAVLSVVIAIVTTDADESTQTANTKKSSEQLSMASTADVRNTKSSKAATSAKKQTASRKTKTKTAKRKAKKPASSSTSSQGTKTRVTRVRWPGMKYRMVRVVEEEKIEPATELRTWSRKQWVDKVTDLRKADNEAAAEQYITAYNEQYPGKDLNRYLK